MSRPDLRTLVHVIDGFGTTDATVVDCALSATEAACRSSHHLLDWDEWNGVAL